MTHSTDVVKTGHIYSEVFTASAYSAQPAMPFLILFWIFFIFTVFRTFIFKWITFLFPVLKIGDLEIDEDLDNYFNCIDDVDRNWSIKEEEYARDVLNMKVLDNQTLTNLKSRTAQGATIKGVHCYDILANPLYLDDFQYFSCAKDNREMYIIDDDDDEGNDNAQSDLVKIVLNLAFLTEERALGFSFDKNAYSQQVKSKIN
jgi:hypothetical protein